MLAVAALFGTLMPSVARAAPPAVGPAATGVAENVGAPTADGAALAGGQDCAAVRKALAASRGVGRVGCVETDTGRARPSAAVTPGCGDNRWQVKRKSGCAELAGTYYLLDRTTGQVVGRMGYTVVSTIAISDGRWTHAIRVTAGVATGFIGSPTLAASPVCGSNCRIVSWLFTGGSTVPFVSGVSVQGSGTFDSTYVAPPVWYSGSRWTWLFNNPAAYPTQSNALDDQPPSHRCDDALSGYRWGCVYDSFQPTHEIGSLRYPTYARHIQLAHNFGMTRVLTRTTNEALRIANRNVACPSSYPRPAGKSCDEYPFASTYEGASNQPYGRTFVIIGGINGGGANEFVCGVPLPRRQPGETGGYSACMINESDNSGGGSDLGVFYLDNRVIDGDRFEVRVV